MLTGIGRRIREFLARIFRRKPPAPGYFVKGHKASLRGWLHAAPWIWPSREYLLYVPRGYGGWKRRALVVMIHGCKQTPEDFALSTRIAPLADEHGWLVLLPRQTDKFNPWSCWNWFDSATSAGHGEAAIAAAQIRAVRRHYRVNRRRIFVAGFSAGGALAAALAVRHPGLFAGAFVHSGLACGAASGPAAALNVMRRGADTDPWKIGEQAGTRALGWRGALAAGRSPWKPRQRRRRDQREADREPVPGAEWLFTRRRQRGRIAASRQREHCLAAVGAHGFDFRVSGWERRPRARRAGGGNGPCLEWWRCCLSLQRSAAAGCHVAPRRARQPRGA